MTLFEKLHAVYEAVDRIEKRGQNSKQNYSYIKASDVTREIRKQLAAQRVYAEINFDFYGEPFNVARDKSPNAPFSTVMVKCSVVFHDLDSIDTATGSGLGTGTDQGDKHAYKAQTGALKYALKNAFLVPDEADPEADETIDGGDQTYSQEPPDFQEAQHAAPRPAPAQKSEKVDGTPISSPKAPQQAAKPVQAASATAAVCSPAPVSGVPAAVAQSTTEAAPVAAPEHGDAYEGPDDNGALPTEEDLKTYRANFTKLGDDLTTAGKLKSSRNLPVNRKVLVFLMKIAGVDDAKKITKVGWDNFFARVEAAKSNPEVGLVGLGKLINKTNGIEDKK